MQPITYQWLPGSTNSICLAQTYTANVPLTFANPVVIPRAGVAALCAIPNNTPQNVKSFLTPQTGSINSSMLNDRFVSFTSTANLSATSFTIVGRTDSYMNKNPQQNYYGTTITEVVTGPNAGTKYSTYEYTEIYSITPNATSASTVSVGMAPTGSLPYIPLDRWNKNAVYTFTVDNVQNGEVEFYLFYLARQYQIIRPSLLTINTNPNEFLLPLESPTSIVINYQSDNVTVEPSPTTWPITLDEDARITFTVMNFPIEALVFSVNNTGAVNTTFDFTLMQQGGKY